MTQFLPLITLLGMSIGLFAVFMFAFKLDQNDWRTKLYPLIMLLFGGVMGLWLHFGSFNTPMNLPNIYMVIHGLFILFGLFHIWFLYRKLFWSKRNGYDAAEDSVLPEAIYSFAILLLMGAGLLGAYGYFSGFPKMGNYWAISIPFIIPFLFMKSYDFLNQIPQKDYSLKWGFTNDPINEINWRWENEVWIHFEVKEQFYNSSKTNRLASFRIKAPRKVPLREVFRLATREYNKNAAEVIVQDLGFEKENNGKIWWLFYIKIIWNQPNTWFRKIRYLDPYSSSLLNEILPNDKIVARRMSTQVAIQNKEEYFEEDDDIPMGILIEE